MSGYDYTTTGLLSVIRGRGMLPTASATGTDTSSLLARASEVMVSELVPLIHSVHEDYLETYSDVALVSGTYSYRIPYRALGNKLRRVCIVDGSGNFVRDLSRSPLEDQQNAPGGYRFQWGSIVLVNDPGKTGDTSNYLRMYYYHRPSKLVGTTEVGLITAIDTGALTVTVSSKPSTFTSLATYDFVRGTPAFECLAIDRAVTLIASSTFTFATLPTGLAVGDYLTLAGESAIPQIPFDLHAVLAQATVCAMLEALGDSEGLGAAVDKYKLLRDEGLKLISTRDDGAPEKIIQRSTLFSGGAD